MRSSAVGPRPLCSALTDGEQQKSLAGALPYILPAALSLHLPDISLTATIRKPDFHPAKPRRLRRLPG